MKMYFKNREALRKFKGNVVKADMKKQQPDVSSNRRWVAEIKHSIDTKKEQFS